MVDDTTLDDWFCREVLPLEPALVRYVRRNWRDPAEIYDLVHDIYALALHGARNDLPRHAQAYVFTIARHHLAQHARRGRIVSFELMADPESLAPQHDLLETDRHLVYLRKVEGLTTREAAERLGVGIDAIEQQLTKGMRALTDFMLGGSGRIARGKATSERQDKRDDR
jgi:RNA polymerase sigma-70 factor (ECF subfamily)